MIYAMYIVTAFTCTSCDGVFGQVSLRAVASGIHIGVNVSFKVVLW